MWPEPILHVDMDSFFVEVERLADPSLRGVPVAVGGAGSRGVIASASYEARRFGVHSAQPTITARRLCPELRVVAPSHGRYSEVSVAVFDVFRSFTPAVEGLSLDEAFLHVGGLRLHYPTATAVAESVRQRIRAELDLPASVGIGSVKFVAKLASEQAKPDGIRQVSVEDQAEFLSALPATSMWGVGPATFAALARLGVETIGDIAALPAESLVAAVGPTTGGHLHDLANGVDPRPVVPDNEAKSISVEETYARDLESGEVVETALLGLSHRLSGRLRVAGARCRTVTLKVRMADFTTVTRATTREIPLDGSRRIHELAVSLLETLADTGPIRLLGLAGTALEPASDPVQLDLETNEDWERVEDSVADVRERFGADSVRPARLLRGLDSPDEGEEP